MSARIGHHPQCPARHSNVSLDRCNCRIPPIVDLTATVTAAYLHTEALRHIRALLVPSANSLVIGTIQDAINFLERLAATLDGSSTQGDEPRVWSGT